MLVIEEGDTLRAGAVLVAAVKPSSVDGGSAACLFAMMVSPLCSHTVSQHRAFQFGFGILLVNCVSSGCLSTWFQQFACQLCLAVCFVLQCASFGSVLVCGHAVCLLVLSLVGIVVAFVVCPF